MMKRFKTKTVKAKHKELIILLIIAIILLFIDYYNKNITKKILDIASTKIEEVTNIYIKNNIVPENVDIEKLININKNDKGEILYVDIDTNYANQIMVSVIKKIQNNIFELEINDSLLKRNKRNTYLKVPLFLADDGALINNLGPKIPVKLNFYEHAFGNIEVELLDYGINNAIIKVYLEVILEQKIYIPYKEEKLNKKFSLLIGSKIITGTVPSIYGGTIHKSSSDLNT